MAAKKTSVSFSDGRTLFAFPLKNSKTWCWSTSLLRSTCFWKSLPWNHKSEGLLLTSLINVAFSLWELLPKFLTGVGRHHMQPFLPRSQLSRWRGGEIGKFGRYYSMHLKLRKKTPRTKIPAPGISNGATATSKKTLGAKTHGEKKTGRRTNCAPQVPSCQKLTFTLKAAALRLSQGQFMPSYLPTPATTISYSAASIKPSFADLRQYCWTWSSKAKLNQQTASSIKNDPQVQV